MAGKTDTTALDFALKKLLGKSNTSNLKSDAQETIGSNIQVGATTVFGITLPSSPAQSLYTVQDSAVEYVVFDVSSISGTTYDANDPGGGGDGAQISGPHGYALSLTGSYQDSTNNSKAGTYPFTDGQVLSGSAGALQIVPGFFSTNSPNPYTITIFESDGAGGIGDQIPLLDEVDWMIDTFSGILFLQDYDSNKIPAYAKGFIYVGDMMSSLTGSGGGGGSGDANAQYLVLQATGSLSAERVFTPSTGILASDAGAGGNYSLSVDNSIVATLTGSQFSGNIGITGSLGVTRGLSGSITKLTDGTSYLIAGSNVTITSGSSGAITIASTGGSGSPGGNNTEVQFNDSGAFAGDSSFIFNKASNTLTVDNLSGSLTKISDGTSYLIAGSNVTIATGSSGAITISSAAGGGGSGDTNAEYVLTTATGSLSNAKVVEAGSGISLVTGSNSLTIIANASSINGRDKQSYIISGAIGADTSVPTIYSDFSDVLYDKNLIDVFLNGQLLHSGSAAEISSADKDYTVFTSGSVKFAFALMVDDQLDVIFSKLNSDSNSADAGAQYLVLEATGSLTNERVFTSGVGLSGLDSGAGSPFTLNIDNSIVATLTGSQFSGNVGITGSLRVSAGLTGSLTQLFDGTPYLLPGNNITLSTGSSGAITISSTDRSKVVYTVTSSHAANSNIDLLNVDFSTVNYLQNKIDVFVNGQLMNSGSAKDYYLPGAFTGSINFTFELFNDDTLSVLTY